MDSEIKHWSDNVKIDIAKIRDLKLYNLAHKTHSIEELHEIAETVTSLQIHSDLLVDALASLDRQPKKNFLQRLFRK